LGFNIIFVYSYFFSERILSSITDFIFTTSSEFSFGTVIEST